jgi:hypothetical protein
MTCVSEGMRRLYTKQGGLASAGAYFPGVSRPSLSASRRGLSRCHPVRVRSGDGCRSRSEELGSLARGYTAGPGESGCSTTRLALASLQSAIRARSTLEAPLRQGPCAPWSIVRASFLTVQLAGRRPRNRGHALIPFSSERYEDVSPRFRSSGDSVEVSRLRAKASRSLQPSLLRSCAVDEDAGPGFLGWQGA